MLTNMLLVFGIACTIGGTRWQVQELRTTSGNANVVMLYVAVAGCLLPAALRLSGQYNNYEGVAGKYNEDAISPQEVTFCRVNAVVLFVLYLGFLIFQLGTHSDEFADDSHNRKSRKFARRNLACRAFWNWMTRKTRMGHMPLPQTEHSNSGIGGGAVERLPFLATTTTIAPTAPTTAATDIPTPSSPASSSPPQPLPLRTLSSEQTGGDEEDIRSANTRSVESTSSRGGGATRRRRGGGIAAAAAAAGSNLADTHNLTLPHLSMQHTSNHHHNHHMNAVSGITHAMMASNSVATSQNEKPKSKSSDWEDLESDEGSNSVFSQSHHSRRRHHDDDDSDHDHHDEDEVPLLSMRMGIVWLLILTLCISSMSDILVDTIDDFAFSMHLSEVFTSMVVVPFFSNVAEQVSAFIFAYRNEMDLCVAVTIGSAVQIATFVLPGTVIIGMTLQRSMTLYFGAYETCCLFFSVVVVGAVLQSGTSNWLTGCMLVGIYIILASGIWFHQQENLTVDEENNLSWKENTLDTEGG
jgi:Ca2+/H+ antiporter